MDLRTFDDGLADAQQCDERRSRIERELGIKLDDVKIDAARLGKAQEKNCEQMFGHVPLPVGLAGPLTLTVSSNEKISLYLPLATTEGALVASVNRGCKALSVSDVKTSSTYRGMTRSLCMEPKEGMMKELKKFITENEDAWKKIAEHTSGHLKVMTYDIEESGPYLFLTIACDTDDAMGMNMTTLAAGAVGKWLEEETNAMLITEAANVDSDKKPSRRTYENGRGYEVNAEAVLSKETIASVLKTTPDAMMKAYDAKILHGSKVAGAIGKNCQAANVVAALYLATGQDSAHIVEGSLADTMMHHEGDGLRISVRLPAILVGVLGGGTLLPAQSSCMSILFQATSALRPTQQLAEVIGAAVLAGEVSLLAALSTHSLGSAHKKLAR